MAVDPIVGFTLLEQSQAAKETTCNQALTDLAQSAGILSKSVAAGGTFVLTTDEAQYGLILLTGAPSTAVIVEAPLALAKTIAFRNDITTAVTVTVRVGPSGTQRKVARQGGRVLLWNGDFVPLPRITAATQPLQFGRDGAFFGGRHQDDPRYWVEGLWIPRNKDLGIVMFYDYQDNAAYLHKRTGVTPTISPAPSSGSLDNVWLDDTTTVVYNSGTSPYPIVIEADMTSNPLPALGNGLWTVGITFRSDAGTTVNPTNIKVEFWNSGGAAYETVFDAAPEPIGSVAVFATPRMLSNGTSNNLVKVKITISGTNALDAALRIQRVMLYHETSEWDPWHLHVKGGRVFGAVTWDSTNKFAGAISGNATPLTFSTGIQAMADANQTPTSAVYENRIIRTTGVLTAQRDLILPLTNGARWLIDNQCTGFGVRAIGASGTGIVIAAVRAAEVWTDGTNFRRATADVDPTV